MELLQENWIWIIFVGLFVWMMLSGGGCCGSRTDHKRTDDSHQH